MRHYLGGGRLAETLPGVMDLEEGVGVYMGLWPKEEDFDRIIEFGVLGIRFKAI